MNDILSYCWWTKSCTTKDDDYPIIYRVWTIPGGAGFLPSTVSWHILNVALLVSQFHETWVPPNLFWFAENVGSCYLLHILCYFWIMLIIQESLHQWIGSLFHYDHVLFIFCVVLYIPGGAGFQPQDLSSLNVFIGRCYTRIQSVVCLIQLCYRGKCEQIT